MAPSWRMSVVLLLLLPGVALWAKDQNPEWAHAHRAGQTDDGPCHSCHQEMAQRIRPARKVLLKFSHRLHQDQKVGCLACHPRGRSPVFQDCQACHAPLVERGRCGSCHPSGATGLLITRSQGQLLQPRGGHGGPDHRPGWSEGHGPQAAPEGQSCERCHASSFCDRCHRGVARPMRQHPADWELVHATVARGGAAQCQKCHRPQSDCLACHRRSGVGLAEKRAVANLRVHPEGFSQEGGHGAEARRNLSSCTACHAEGDCIRCHGAAGVGMSISPHPSGFGRRCGLMYSRNPRPCLKCHRAEDLGSLCP